MRQDEILNDIFDYLKNEVATVNDRWPLYNSPHEGYAIIKEEVDELWDDVKANKNKDSISEAYDVAVTAIRYILSARNGNFDFISKEIKKQYCQH